MALTELTDNLNIHQSLPDNPTLTAPEIKSKFDEGVNIVKKYINETLTKEIDSRVSSLQNKDATIETNIASLNTQIGNITNLIYPVGSIYISANEVNPQMLFGGIWERIQDRFLLAVGEDYELGETGGEKEHLLTIEEMPEHNHKSVLHISDGLRNADNGDDWHKQGINTDIGQPSNNTSVTGGGKAHNNMPPYIAVNIWKRVS